MNETSDGDPAAAAVSATNSLSSSSDDYEHSVIDVNSTSKSMLG